MIGYQCRDCRRIYSRDDEQDKCICGGDDWRKIRVTRCKECNAWREAK